MLNYKILKTRKDVDEWYENCVKWDIDFEHPGYDIPCVMMWVETESNGYPDIYYMELSANDLEIWARQIKWRMNTLIANILIAFFIGAGLGAGIILDEENPQYLI